MGGDLGGPGWDLSLLTAIPCDATLVSPAGRAVSGCARSHGNAAAPARDLVAGQSIWQAGTTVWHFTPLEIR